MKSLQRNRFLIWGFLLVQAFCYLLILTVGGDLLRYVSFGAIFICCLFSLTQFPTGNKWISLALCCTVGADFFLVICSPIQQLSGMIFFLAAQIIYATMLQYRFPCRPLLIARSILCVVGLVLTAAILQDKTDLLAQISVCYYVNLIMNILCAIRVFKRIPLTAIGFCLFLLCDTVIGLQCAADVYLPISSDSTLYKLIFMDFNLAWFFYLPSQVLLSISSIHSPKTHNMKLDPQPYEMIRSGAKRYELRLNDRKRRLLVKEDHILFVNNATGEKMTCKVVAIHRFPDFRQLYCTLPAEECGYSDQEATNAKPEDMLQYYSLSQQKKYGVLAIEIMPAD